MDNRLAVVHTSNVEIKLAKIYIFCLPFRMIALLSFLQDFAGPLVLYFDAVINIIGLFVWIQNEGNLRISIRNRNLFRTIAYSILYLNLSSVLMAVVMYLTYGDCNGKSPFVAIIPMILFYSQYILIFLYNIRVFEILDYNSIKKVLNNLCKTLLVIGYVQVLVMHGIGAGIYDVLATIIGGFNLSERLSKLCLTLSEGAAAGCLMGTLVFPYLFAKYINGEKKCIYEILLWLPLLIFSHSTTAMILFAVVFIIFLIRNKKMNVSSMIGLSAFSFFIVGTLFFISSKSATNENDTVQYLLFEKIFDENNGSTISRSVPFVLNWGVFTEMPIMGVGNGLQGYFFNKYFPREYFYVEGSDVSNFYEVSQTKIANGGCFFPGYFSGYGIIGLFVLLYVISRFVRTYRIRKKKLGLFGDMFVMGSVGFLVMGMQGEAYCLYYAWFVLSIPFMYWKNDTLFSSSQ